MSRHCYCQQIGSWNALGIWPLDARKQEESQRALVQGLPRCFCDTTIILLRAIKIFLFKTVIPLAPAVCTPESEDEEGADVSLPETTSDHDFLSITLLTSSTEAI